MAVTDANLLLGRLVVDYFPKIFGKTEDQPLDIEASQKEFAKIAKEVNDSLSFDKDLSLDEVVYGSVHLILSICNYPSEKYFGYRFIKIANETMCRPIRALTEARGFSTASHM